MRFTLLAAALALTSASAAAPSRVVRIALCQSDWEVDVRVIDIPLRTR